ncbi:MAG TPA: outer membrane lipoprotein carrier protein LolA [Pyrinomonadaceae bacterium]|jgi:outer membrane lipoprotein-sorting protein
MSKFPRAGMTAIIVAFVFGAFSALTAQAQGTTEILKRMDRYYNARQTLEADVKMEKRNAQLDETDVYLGKVWYVPAKGKQQMAVRLNWSTPTEEHLLVINGLYKLSRPRLEIEYRGKIEKAKNNASVAGPLSFMSMSRRQLTDNYEIAVLGNENLSSGAQTIRLKLTPKKTQKYKVAEIWVDGNGKPLQMKVVENNGDATTVLLTNAKDNVSIPQTAWVLETRAGTKIINN